MKLIIAEKPSLARNIIAGIGASTFTKQDGYYENSEYFVSWAFGHLFGLIDIEEYDPDYDKDAKNPWTLDNLPCFPEEFKFSLKKDPKTKSVDSGVKKQYIILKSLINDKRTDTIINAGDADREGQIIIDLIIKNSGVKGKSIKRLWLPDQTPETVREGLRTLKDNDEYINLANEGFARTYTDWLYGVNLTRYASLKSGTLLRVGRIIVPVVKAIYDRDMEIKNFMPEKYYSVISKEKTKGEIIELISKTTFAKEKMSEAKELCNKYNSVNAVVDDITTEKKTIGAGKLYSLSKAQGVLGRKYKMSLKKSLEIIQKLYEAGYITYPRTNSEYMATAEKSKIKSIIEILNKSGYPVVFKDSKSIFDDSKIESHSALTPTTKMPDLSKMSEDEKRVYETIRNRFIAVFCSKPCIVNRSEIKISVSPYETFTLKGDVMIEKGWTEYDDYDKKDKVLPSLKKGDIINTAFKPVEKETTPPKHYTLETLNNYLKNPFKKDLGDDSEGGSDDEDYKAMLAGLELGTEATRTGIIENAINSKYISLKNNTYYIEEPGIYYIKTLETLKINIDKYKTAQVGKHLKDVYKGDSTIEEVLDIAENEISEMFSHKDIKIASVSLPGKNAVCKCPLCGKDIVKCKWGYGCSGYKDGCKFSVSGTIAGKTITSLQVNALVGDGKTGIIKGFTSKSGKKFDAVLKMEKLKDEDGNLKVKISFDFGHKPEEKKEITAKCPRCGGTIKNDKYAWKCENGCGFSLGYIVAGKQITDTQLYDLITKGNTEKIKGFKSKTGKLFSASLALDDGKNVKFQF